MLIGAVQIIYARGSVQIIVAGGHGVALGIGHRPHPAIAVVGKAVRHTQRPGDHRQIIVGVVIKFHHLIQSIGQRRQLAVGVVAKAIGVAGRIHCRQRQVLGIVGVLRQHIGGARRQLRHGEQVNVVARIGKIGRAPRRINRHGRLADGVVLILLRLRRAVVQHTRNIRWLVDETGGTFPITIGLTLVVIPYPGIFHGLFDGFQRPAHGVKIVRQSTPGVLPCLAVINRPLHGRHGFFVPEKAHSR